MLKAKAVLQSESIIEDTHTHTHTINNLKQKQNLI